MAGLLQQKNGEKRMAKQIGCMSGLIQIFDRHKILAGKRTHSAKRLAPSIGVSALPETVSSGESNESSPEILNPEPHKHAIVVPASPDSSQSSPSEKLNGPLRSLALVPTFEKKNVKQNSSFVSCKEMHRLSIDSKVPVSNSSVTNGDDNRRRSTSVVARLMGLEPLSSSDKKTHKMAQKPALQRSASEARVSGDRIHSKYIDDNNFQVKQPNKSQKQSVEFASGNSKSVSSRTSQWRSRSFFDSADCFPELNQTAVAEDLEKKLKLKKRGIDGQYNDISTLKQILEVLQLKGLLHSTSDFNRGSQWNFVYDRNLHSDESSIVIVKPYRSSASKLNNQRSATANDSGGTRNKSVHQSSGNQKPTESSTIDSPNKTFIKSLVTDYESSSISEITRSKWNGRIEGKSLLQRCDKMLDSIAEMNSATESPRSSATVLPSPVSVLDSGFDFDEPSTNSQSIDFKAHAVDDFLYENVTPKLSPTTSTELKEFTSNDSDFLYISKIVRATTSQYLNEDSDIFFSIEKQFYTTENTSNASKHQRKLVFDVILEVIDRKRQLPPWKALIEDSVASLKHIWFEFHKIRDLNYTGDGLLELVSDVLKKDLININDWMDYPIESSEVVLDIERMIFKDLVGEAIRDLAEFGKCRYLRTRRKLVF